MKNTGCSELYVGEEEELCVDWFTQAIILIDMWFKI